MNENAARVDWAGAGVRIPGRFVTPAVVRLAVERVLADASRARRARELAAWAADHDAGTRAAQLLEAMVTCVTPGSVLGV
jgi:UDP:flavonoid glycosyltransferase YjiC (YdhE family)